MSKHAIVWMTDVVATMGDADLIEFASCLPDSMVWVVLTARNTEPMSHEVRLNSLAQCFADRTNVVIRGSVVDEAPQDTDDPNFWAWWTAEINRNCLDAGGRWDYVVACQGYGVELAQAVGAQFVSYDMRHTRYPVDNSIVREDPWGHWAYFLPAFRREHMVTLTVFGQECVGKTTLARRVSELLGVEWIDEWCRLHLETVGPDIDEAMMEVIAAGQTAWQGLARHKADSPVLIQDTDLYSTLGYYMIGDVTPPPWLRTQADLLASDLYIVLPDDIPFIPDPLRYGGDVRESALGFWTELLDEVGHGYLIVPSGTVEEKAQWIASQVCTLVDARWALI